MELPELGFNSISADMLKVISDYDGISGFKGAYNIREDGQCAGRMSSENIEITSKTDNPGIDIRVKPYTKGETVFIPACVTHSGVEDLVYNDFYIGEGADVIVVAGCGVHNDGEEQARHNGIHLGGVDYSNRTTSAVLDSGAKIIVRERILTDNSEEAISRFDVKLNGEDSGVDLVSRSVAKGSSHQAFYSVIEGNSRCTGHSACDAILSGNGRVDAQPALNASHVDAELIHEAAIGKIAGEQILKLCSLGLTREEAEEKIVQGFLK